MKVRLSLTSRALLPSRKTPSIYRWMHFCLVVRSQSFLPYSRDMISTRPFLLLFSDMTAIETPLSQTYPSAPNRVCQVNQMDFPDFQIYFPDNTLAI